MLASTLMTASALILIMLGTLHLFYTFRGSKLAPHDASLHSAMAGTHPRISRETTMWKAWVGFNASHSLGALLFGLVYGYLALAHPALLFASGFLLVVGLAMLSAWVGLAWLYWFRIPLRGLSLALGLYVAAVVAHVV